jgi:hypothetical protein
MPDYNSFQVVRDSEYEELFDDSLKLEASSPYTKEIDLKGCIAFMLHQFSSHVSSPARTEVSEVGGWDGALVIDDDLNSTTAEIHTVGTLSGSPTYCEVVIDFGSIAVRDIATKAEARMSCNSSGMSTWYSWVSVEYSTDDISYSGGGEVVRALGAQSGGQNITATREDLAVNMRYVKIYSGGSGSTACNGYGNVFETWIPGQSLGTATLTFEQWNPLTSAWETVDLGLTPTVVNSDAGSNVTQKTGVAEAAVSRNFPNGVGKIRAKYTITDGCNAKAGIQKIFA